MLRERWVPGGFDLDHFRPIAIHPEKATDYDNLLYCCSTCNSAKRQQIIPDPIQHFSGESVIVNGDGLLIASTTEAKFIIEQLGLNRKRYQEFRQVWLKIVEILTSHPTAVSEVLRYPSDLPDLSTLRPPGGNRKPEGIEQSFHRRRERGELPDTY
ncbi:HNH endonuclease signature motif containing protein [Fimbriiglobus ruber]|uniref:HNH endonuclease signature motif containing protein n=1 Tax=Fimbriiglobus ruber TaxID=1908690 RepID=UPI001379B5FB|nr:HNH endonuclease signature motif containing protein [Fimbriiglobus ruber]